jgi:hypothetical protein
MGLLATLTAYDLGYIDATELTDRSIARSRPEALERYEGHLFNWYDTQQLAPLAPRYVSTVDSGNLACALVALAEGLCGVADAPLPTPRVAACRDGYRRLLKDSLERLRMQRADSALQDRIRFALEEATALMTPSAGAADGARRRTAALEWVLDALEPRPEEPAARKPRTGAERCSTRCGAPTRRRTPPRCDPGCSRSPRASRASPTG